MFVIILGCPRSGTSAIAGVASALGVYFGEDRYLQPADANNVDGYKELAIAHYANDDILRVLGNFTWASPPSLDKYYDVVSKAPLKHHTDYAVPSINFIVDYLRNGNVNFGIKDPRMMFTLPFWLGAQSVVNEKIKLIFTMRKKDGVVNSWKKSFKENARHPKPFPMISINLYLQWQQALLKKYDHIIMNYDDALREPQKNVLSISKYLGIENSTLIDSAVQVLKPKLKHF